MNLKNKRVLVTGGAGFIGSEVVSQLLAKKSLVTVLDNFSSGKRQYLPKSKQLKIIKGDIRDEKITAKAVKDQEVIINLAALPFIPDSFHHPSDFFSVNTMGSVNVLWKAINAKTPELFIHISTSEVYGSAQKTPMDENHPTAPHSTYAVSKLAAEDQVLIATQQSVIDGVVLRLGTIFGPSIGMRFHTAVNKFCWQAVTNQPVTAWTTALDQYRPYLGVGDCGRAIAHILDRNLCYLIFYSLNYVLYHQNHQKSLQKCLRNLHH